MPEFSAQAVVEALSRASDTIRRAVGREMQQAAEATRAAVIAAYPDGPSKNTAGNRMRNQVHARRGRSNDEIAGQALTWIASSTAYHAHFYEQGTGPRVDPTRRNAFRGASPRHWVFVPIAQRERAEALRRAAALLDRTQEL